jgi:very-short-patch-repair endonuclease
VRTGRLHRLQQGAFCEEAGWAAADPTSRAVLAARAVALVRRSPARYAFSHVSAAALHGWPVSEPLADRVWLTVEPGGYTRREDRIVQQVAPLGSEDVGVASGLPCTAPARTVADCLRHLPAQEAVVLGDAALRSRVVDPRAVGATLERRWPRATAANDLLLLLDRNRESGLESRSAVVMHQYGLPRPRTQVRILDRDGRVVARVDFAWMDHGVVGEADGLVKYGEARSVAEEKQREARLQALGLVVVRWTARHLHGDPPLLVAQLRAALEHGDAARFRGRVA